MITEEIARQFAHDKHLNQMYGDNNYDVHFLEVVSNLKLYGASFEEIIAGYLHDTIEDTATTSEEIEQKFNKEIADIVSLLSDKPGKNRTERHLNTYYLIRQNKKATMVKLCDRLANMKQCLRSQDKKKSQMYVKEYMQFKFALYSNIPEHASVWLDLDQVFNELRSIS
jgi:(p)ppGpp synthase/HD superfamily hydrolase